MAAVPVAVAFVLAEPQAKVSREAHPLPLPRVVAVDRVRLERRVLEPQEATAATV
jgi:hypothetical protein